MTEVVLFIYLLGVIVSMIVWSIRQFKGDASLVETMYCPIVFLSSWIYVFEILKKINKMLEVSASEIVTADKMRGVGPANIIFTAGPNPVAEDRRGVAKVTAGGESKSVTITQAAGEQVVVIPEFDYLVLRYGWESEDGSDFDTATGFTNTGISDVDNKYVGWSKQWATTQQQVGDYLIYGGDNMQSGLEGALIKMKTLLSAPGMDESDPNINADIYGNWYGNRGRGNVVVSFTAYLGGEMVKQGFNFINEGGEEVYSDSITTNVSAHGETNYQNIKGLYTKMGTMVYNKEKRDCVIVIG